MTMKSKFHGDAMFSGDQRGRSRTIGVLSALLFVLAAGALALQAGPIGPGDRTPRPLVPVPDGGTGMPGEPRAFNAPGGILQTIPAARGDRFVIVAPADIDPKMVVKAPLDLDARMVLDPETDRRGVAPGGRSSPPGLAIPPGSWMPLPRGVQPIPSRPGRSGRPGPGPR
jgi:hypothetical protein